MDLVTFALGQATPYAVGFVRLQGVLTAALQDWAGQAQGLRFDVPVTS